MYGNMYDDTCDNMYGTCDDMYDSIYDGMCKNNMYNDMHTHVK